MKKIWILGDLHFGAHVNSLKWLDIQSAFMDWFVWYVKEYMSEGDELIQLGDIFDNRQSININVMRKAKRGLIELSKLLPVHVITGNHDAYYLNDNSVTSVGEVFEGIPNITVYTEPEIVEVAGIRSLMLPWESDPKKMEKTLSDSIVDVVFCHAEIQGMTYDNGFPIKDGLSMEALKPFDMVISGHIHKRYDSGHIKYVGTPYHITRSDIGNQKGFHTLSKEDGLKFIPNQESPEFKEINVFDFLELSIEDIKDFMFNSFVDVLWENRFAKNFSFIKVSDMLKRHDVKYRELSFPPYSLKTEDDIARAAARPNKMTMKEMSKIVLENKGYNAKEIEDALTYFDDLNQRLIEKKKNSKK